MPSIGNNYALDPKKMTGLGKMLALRVFLNTIHPSALTITLRVDSNACKRRKIIKTNDLGQGHA